MSFSELSRSLQINEAGHLTIGGCDTVELAHTYDHTAVCNG